MIKLGMALGLIWLIGGILLTLMAISRFIFDYSDRHVKFKRVESFGWRLAAAWFWWVFLLSPDGREMLAFLIRGDKKRKIR